MEEGKVTKSIKLLAHERWGPAVGEGVWEEGGCVRVKTCWVLRSRMCMWLKSNDRQRREGGALGIGMGGDPTEVGVCASHMLA